MLLLWRKRFLITKTICYITKNYIFFIKLRFCVFGKLRFSGNFAENCRLGKKFFFGRFLEFCGKVSGRFSEFCGKIAFFGKSFLFAAHGVLRKIAGSGKSFFSGGSRSFAEKFRGRKSFFWRFFGELSGKIAVLEKFFSGKSLFFFRIFLFFGKIFRAEISNFGKIFFRGKSFFSGFFFKNSLGKSFAEELQSLGLIAGFRAFFYLQDAKRNAFLKLSLKKSQAFKSQGFWHFWKSFVFSFCGVLRKNCIFGKKFFVCASWCFAENCGFGKKFFFGRFSEFCGKIAFSGKSFADEFCGVFRKVAEKLQFRKSFFLRIFSDFLRIFRDFFAIFFRIFFKTHTISKIGNRRVFGEESEVLPQTGKRGKNNPVTAYIDPLRGYLCKDLYTFAACRRCLFTKTRLPEGFVNHSRGRSG